MYSYHQPKLSSEPFISKALKLMSTVPNQTTSAAKKRKFVKKPKGTHFKVGNQLNKTLSMVREPIASLFIVQLIRILEILQITFAAKEARTCALVH